MTVPLVHPLFPVDGNVTMSPLVAIDPSVTWGPVSWYPSSSLIGWPWAVPPFSSIWPPPHPPPCGACCFGDFSRDHSRWFLPLITTPASFRTFGGTLGRGARTYGHGFWAATVDPKTSSPPPPTSLARLGGLFPSGICGQLFPLGPCAVLARVWAHFTMRRPVFWAVCSTPPPPTPQF